MDIILGSQSKGRQKVLEQKGRTFTVMPAHIDEKAIRHEDPRKLTLAIANAKADALIPAIHQSAILITSDQVVVWNGKIREKPETADEAGNFLRSYATAPAETVTAVVVVNTSTGKRREGVDTAKVWFRALPEERIQQYIAEGDAFSHAGGFAIDHPYLKDFIDHIEGTETSVFGLPWELTEQFIKDVQQ